LALIVLSKVTGAGLVRIASNSAFDCFIAASKAAGKSAGFTLSHGGTPS
jgi:hypothetical protein